MTKFMTKMSVDWEKTGTRTSVSAGKRKLEDADGRQVDDDDTECKDKCKTVMFVRNKAFSEQRLSKQCKILYFLSRTSNNDDEEFLVLSDRFEWKNLYFPHEVDSTFNLNEMIKSECLSQFRFGKKRHFDAIKLFPYKVYFLCIKDK